MNFNEKSHIIEKFSQNMTAYEMMKIKYNNTELLYKK